MHSKLFHEWVSSPFLNYRNVHLFLEQKKSISVFTKEDLFSFHEDFYYINLIDELLLSTQIPTLVSMFSKEELIRYVTESISISFQKELVSYFASVNDVDFLYELFSSCFETFLFPFTFLLDSISRKDERFLKFLSLKSYYRFFSMNYEEKDHPLMKIILNDKDKVEFILKSIPFTKSFFRKLSVLRESPYYSSLFFQYKESLYYKFLTFSDSLDLEKVKEYSVFYLILDELLEKEAIDFSDIQYINSGYFSKVFLFSSLVLKIGKKHSIYEIPNCPSLLYPLVRKQVESLNFYFEVSSFCDTSSITDKDVYQVYKEIRENGYIWLDPHVRNVGRLLRSNGSYFFPVNPESIGFIGEGTKPKSFGELICLDLDFVTKEDFDWEFYDTLVELRSHSPYELRYQRELRGK